jgi:hypothetical protein
MTTENRLLTAEYDLVQDLLEAESTLTLVDDILPAGMTQPEVRSLRLTIEAYTEKVSPSFDAIINGRKTSVRLLGYVGMGSVCVGDFISAGSISLELIEECGFRGFMKARKISKEMKFLESL